jgi:hypothetical protein
MFGRVLFHAMSNIAHFMFPNGGSHYSAAFFARSLSPYRSRSCSSFAAGLGQFALPRQSQFVSIRWTRMVHPRE